MHASPDWKYPDSHSPDGAPAPADRGGGVVGLAAAWSADTFDTEIVLGPRAGCDFPQAASSAKTAIVKTTRVAKRRIFIVATVFVIGLTSLALGTFPRGSRLP